MPARAPSLLLTLAALLLSSAARADETGPLRTDSRSPYVHRLTLYDHDGRAIAPKDVPPVPYSPRATCGKCHAYAAIAHGWHFNANEPDVPPGRPGEPWLYVDPTIGTVLPLSGRDWPGAFTPAEVGLSDWQFTKRFGHHLPGDGFAAPSDDDRNASDESLRWNISGVVEIDCLLCHAANNAHDPAEIARQIDAENFKWIPTVAAGLAVLRGEARKLPDDWDPYSPPNPDFPEQNPPQLIYDKARFDPDDRVLFDVTRTPPAERCYFCHTVQPVSGDPPPARRELGRDVHLAAGLTCTDCHRNDISHAITRGYPGETAAGATVHDRAVASYSCAGCHYGDRLEPDVSTATDELALGGRYGAPLADHPGLPSVHFEKLTCTACHSGPWPQSTPQAIQTALAHGLGLASRDRTPADLPHIAAPIFATTAAGQLAPHRLVWPQYFATLAGNAVTPVPLAAIEKTFKQTLRARTKATNPPPLTDDEITTVLTALATDHPANQTPVYLRDGYVWRRSDDNQLTHEPHAAAAPYRWPLAHDVRPASQSLGVRGCTDCHAADAPIFFGATQLTPTDPPPPQARMLDLQDYDPLLAARFADSFRARSAYKVFTAACLVLIVSVLLTYTLRGVGAIARWAGGTHAQ